MLEPTSTTASEFGAHIEDHLKRLTRAKAPTALTRHGKLAAFVLSPAQYRAYSKAVEELETLRAADEGRTEIRKGRGITLSHLRDGLDQIKAKHRSRR